MKSRTPFWLLLSAVLGTTALGVACGGDLGNVLTGGTFNGASGRQVELARQARLEMCCSITIVDYNVSGL
jgi:hypothetical protein